MKPRRPPVDPGSDDATTVEDAPGAGALSPFEAAQGMLQAALDEVRGVAPTPPTPPPAPRTQPPEPARRDEPPRAKATGKAPARRADTARPPAAPAPRPAPVTAPVDEVDPAADAKLSVHRRRRRPAATTTTAAAATTATSPRPAPTEPELGDGLGEDLFESRGQKSRRRKGAAAAAAATTAGVAAATTADTAAPAPASTSGAPARPAGTPGRVTKRDAVATPPIVGPPQPPQPIDPVVAQPSRRPAGTPTARTAPPPSPPASRRRHRGVLVAVAAVIALALVAGLFVVVGGGDGTDESAVRTGGQARLTFPVVRTTEGAEVTRVWTLRGDRGDEFVGTLAFANPTPQPLSTIFTEVIPKSLAATVDDISFVPQPRVIQADPVVQYSVTVPAGETFTARYTISVRPEGADRARLEAWAEELDATTTTTTTRLRPSPTAPGTAVTTPPATTARGSGTGSGTGRQPSPGRQPAPDPTAPPTVAPEPPPPGPDPTTPPPTTPPTTVAPPPTAPPVTTATIVIRVLSAGGTGRFDFAGSLGAFSLTTTGSPNGTASWSVTVEPGSYSATQVGFSDGWFLSTIECSGGGSGAKPTAQFVVGAGNTASCRFVNVPA